MYVTDNGHCKECHSVTQNNFVTALNKIGCVYHNCSLLNAWNTQVLATFAFELCET